MRRDAVGEELLVCVTIAPDEDAWCECGRRVLTAREAGPFTGALDIELACPRCPAQVIVRIEAPG